MLTKTGRIARGRTVTFNGGLGHYDLGGNVLSLEERSCVTPPIWELEESSNKDTQKTIETSKEAWDLGAWDISVLP